MPVDTKIDAQNYNDNELLSSTRPISITPTKCSISDKSDSDFSRLSFDNDSCGNNEDVEHIGSGSCSPDNVDRNSGSNFQSSPSPHLPSVGNIGVVEDIPIEPNQPDPLNRDTNQQNFIPVAVAYLVQDVRNITFSTSVFQEPVIPMTTVVVNDSWNERRVCKRNLSLTYGMLCKILSLLSIVIIYLLITINRNNITIINDSSAPSMAPTFKATLKPIHFELIESLIFRSPRSDGISDETHVISDDSGYFSLSKNGDILAVAGNSVSCFVYLNSELSNSSNLACVPFLSSNINNTETAQTIYITSDVQYVAIGYPFLDSGSGKLEVYKSQISNKDGNEVQRWIQIGKTLHGNEVKGFFGSKAIINDAGTRLTVYSKGIEQLQIFDLIDDNWEITKTLENVLHFSTSVDGVMAVIDASSEIKVFEAEKLAIIWQHQMLFPCTLTSISENGNYLLIGCPNKSYLQSYKFDRDNRKYVKLGDGIYGKKGTFFGIYLSQSLDGRRFVVSGRFQSKIFEIQNDSVIEVRDISWQGSFYKRPVMSGNSETLAYGFLSEEGDYLVNNITILKTV